MFELGDKVRIKYNSVIGTVVDITTVNGALLVTVESDVRGTSGGYGGEWKMYDCTEQDIEKYNVKTA